MKHTLLRGQLTTWNDDRGFGFITPDNNNSRHIFIHVSALKGMSRRPVVGDIICYEVEDHHGKMRAAHAFIENTSLPSQQNTPQHLLGKSNSIIDFAILIASVILVMMIAFGLFIFVQSNSSSTSPSILMLITKPGCIIKGNISINNGNRYYHLPGMKDYDLTVITPDKGERWFCTEEEAISQGWRKAPR